MTDQKPTTFRPSGPPRYAHQRAGLRRIVETKGVHALLFDPGCIYGDAEMIVNRGGKSFRIDLRTLVHMLNGGGRGRWGTQKWDLSIPTMIGRWTEDDTLRLVQITGAWESGVKMTYTVTTETGRSIRATDEHPFLTVNGWRRLDELKPGDGVLVRGPQATGKDREPKPRYRERAGLRHHPYAYKRDATTSPYRVAEHRLVVEADRSELSLPQYLDILRTGRTPPRPILFLTPKQVVHHKDGNPKNNRIENLEVLDSQAEHNAVHDVTSRVLHKAVSERVVSVEPYGEEETFDLEVADDPHCFLADGFVVHNTGKTATTLDYASLLALKSPTGEARVLVIAPLAALDTWVLQAPKWVAHGVDVWAESLGGSIRQRAHSLAARGGQPFKGTRVPKTVAARSYGATTAHSLALRVGGDTYTNVRVRGAGGADPGLLSAPRLVLCAVNLDAFKSRQSATPGSSRTLLDLMVEAVRRFQPDLIVVDESHRIKGASSNTSRGLARLTPLCRRRILLTGTVMPHSPLDVYGQWRFLDPEAFGTRLADGTVRRTSFSQFRSRFARLGGWMGKEVVGFRNLDEMQDEMAKLSTVARKDEVLDLPPTTDAETPVELSPAERQAYEDMKKNLAATLADGSQTVAPNMLAQMMRLRQITSGFLKNDTGQIVEVGHAKSDVIASLVHDTLAGEKRVVVFSHFRHEIARLADRLAAKGTEVVTVTGDTKPEERAAVRARFGSDDPARIVLIAQIKTMSLAVNELVTASHAIFASLPTQRDDFVQARDRLDRIGQTRPVTFWYAVVPGSVDSVILTAHRQRTDLESAMLRHIVGDPDAT